MSDEKENCPDCGKVLDVIDEVKQIYFCPDKEGCGMEIWGVEEKE
jgi:hypothetical protein